MPKSNLAPLLFGSTGIAGQAINEYLISQGADVTVVERAAESKSISKRLFMDLFKIPDIDIGKFTSVIYAAQSRKYKISPPEYADLSNINVVLPTFLAKKCFEGNIPFVYFSSGSVYQDTENELNEASPLRNANEITPYTASKLFGESSVLSVNPKAIVLRPFYIVGLGAKKPNLIANLVESIKFNQKIHISGNKGMLFQPIASTDVARACVHLITRGESGIYNLSGPNPLYLTDVIRILSEQLDISPIIEVNKRESITFRVSNSKLLNTGFNYVNDVEKMLEEVALKLS